MKTFQLTFYGQSIKLFDKFLIWNMSISAGCFRKVVTKTKKGSDMATYYFDDASQEDVYRIGYDWANFQFRKFPNRVR